MKKIKPYLGTIAIVVAVIVVVFRFGIGRQQIVGA